MGVLALGIAVFLGVHFLATFRETRAALIERFGPEGYKRAFSLTAFAGLALIVWGFVLYRAGGMIPVWTPPAWARHVAMPLMWIAFVALAAKNTGPGKIRGWLRHPMLVGIKTWALAHLLANGDAGSMLLFGSFLGFAAYDRIAVKKRGDIGAPRSERFTRGDAVALGAGTLAYAAMIALHPWLIGVSVFGR